MLYCAYLFLCLRLGLFMSYLFDPLISILIFITINHLVSLAQKKLFFWICLSKVHPQSVAFLIFAIFSLVLLIKVLLIEKACTFQNLQKKPNFFSNITKTGSTTDVSLAFCGIFRTTTHMDSCCCRFYVIIAN